MISIQSYPHSQSQSQSQSLSTSSSYSSSSAVAGPESLGAAVAKPSAPEVIRTPEDAINVMRARLEQQLEANMGALERAPKGYGERFEPPSAAQVADTIVSFVQQRLQNEEREGADDNRLADLLFSAEKGIALGFEQARAQIEAMGLMSESLAGDIAQSFERVGKALEVLRERFLGVTQDETANRPSGGVEPAAEA